MLGLVLVLPLLFSPPEGVIGLQSNPPESVSFVTKVIQCIDERSGKDAYCFIVTAPRAEVTLLVVDGTPVSLKMWDGVFTYTIWER